MFFYPSLQTFFVDLSKKIQIFCEKIYFLLRLWYNKKINIWKEKDYEKL